MFRHFFGGIVESFACGLQGTRIQTSWSSLLKQHDRLYVLLYQASGNTLSPQSKNGRLNMFLFTSLVEGFFLCTSVSPHAVPQSYPKVEGCSAHVQHMCSTADFPSKVASSFEAAEREAKAWTHEICNLHSAVRSSWWSPTLSDHLGTNCNSSLSTFGHFNFHAMICCIV